MGIKKEFTLSEAQFITVFEDTMASTLAKPENQIKFLRPLEQRIIIYVGLFAVIMLLAVKGGYISAITVSICSAIYACFLAYMYLYLPHCYKQMALKIFRTSNAIQNSQFIEVSADGIICGGEGHNASLDWSQIYKIQKGKHNYLIFLNFSHAIGIPLDLLSEEEKAILEYYNRQLPPILPECDDEVW